MYKILVFRAVADKGKGCFGNFLLYQLKCLEDAGNVVKCLMRTGTDEIGSDGLAEAELRVVQFYDIGDDGVGYMMLVEYLGEESRKDDIGMGTSKEVVNQTWVLSEELFAASAVIGQHDAFLQPSSDSDADDGRKESPSRAAVDVQYVIPSSFTKKLYGKK